MALKKRQEDILEIINQEKRIKVDDLSIRYKVTEQSIRRDLIEICARGLAIRTHGGARIVNSITNLEYEKRRSISSEAKARIGKLAGGIVRQSDGAIIGENTVEFISNNYKADFAIIGASALDEDGSILDYDSREVSVAKSMLNNSRKKILVCDNSKFEITAPHRISEIREIDIFVTDKNPPDRFMEIAKKNNTELKITDRI